MAEQLYTPAPRQLDYTPLFNWRPMRPNPRMWRHEFMLPLAVDRSVDRSIARYLSEVLNQGPLGSCTANSVVEGVYACARINGNNDPVLSRMLDYYLSRKKEGSFPQDAGAGTDDSAGVILANGGLCAETVWPYDARAAELPPAAVASAQKYLSISQFQPIAQSNWVDGCLSAMDQLQPTLYAMAWYNDWFNQFGQTGVLGGASGGLAGYHQVLVTGWSAKYQLVRLRNSWGETSPTRTDILSDSVAGDFFVPLSYFSNGVCQELCALYPSGGNPNPNPNPPPPSNLVASAGGPYSAVVGQSLSDIHMTAAASGGTAPYTWSWIIAGVVYGHDNPLRNPAVLKPQSSYPIVFNVSVSVTDAAGNKVDSPVTTLTVTDKPAPPPPSPVGLSKLVGTLTDGTTKNLWP